MGFSQQLYLVDGDLQFLGDTVHVPHEQRDRQSADPETRPRSHLSEAGPHFNI
jgi:hypothetical protein